MITAKEFAELNQYDLDYYDEGGYQGIDTEFFAKKLIEFAKLHVKSALKEASEKVEHLWDNNENELFNIDKDSILNAYPLENIK